MELRAASLKVSFELVLYSEIECFLNYEVLESLLSLKVYVRLNKLRFFRS